MNSEVKGVLISIMALVVAGGMSAFNANETAQIKDVQQEIQGAQFTQDDVWTTLKADRGQLNSLIIPISGYDDAVLRNIIAGLQKDNSQLKSDLNKTNAIVDSINAKILTVTALQHQITQAVPQAKDMFSLQLLKSDGNYVPSGEYLQSETVYVTGKYDGPTTQYDIMFKKAGQLVLERRGLNMPTDGIFSYYFNLEHKAELGQYTITVTINGKLDTLSFEIV